MLRIELHPRQAGKGLILARRGWLIVLNRRLDLAFERMEATWAEYQAESRRRHKSVKAEKCPECHRLRIIYIRALRRAQQLNERIQYLETYEH